MTDRRRIKVWSNFTNSYVEYFIPTLHQLHENARNTLDHSWDKVEKQKVHGIIALPCTRVKSSAPYFPNYTPPPRERLNFEKQQYNVFRGDTPR